jgi:hypothetical protein
VNVVDSSAWLEYFATAQAFEAAMWTQAADFEGLTDVRFRAKRTK